jgi:hypothetical protein
MKDFTINGWSLRFDNGTSRIIREARGITEENAMAGLTKWEEMAPWILLGGLKRNWEKFPPQEGAQALTITDARTMMEDLSPAETVELINAYVKAMTVTVDEGQATVKEGEPEKKS